MCAVVSAAAFRTHIKKRASDYAKAAFMPGLKGEQTVCGSSCVFARYVMTLTLVLVQATCGPFGILSFADGFKNGYGLAIFLSCLRDLALPAI